MGQAAHVTVGARVTFSAQEEAQQGLGSGLVGWGQLTGLWGGTGLPSATIVKGRHGLAARGRWPRRR